MKKVPFISFLRQGKHFGKTLRENQDGRELEIKFLVSSWNLNL
jgi:hypothetical protein